MLASLKSIQNWEGQQNTSEGESVQAISSNEWLKWNI